MCHSIFTLNTEMLMTTGKNAAQNKTRTAHQKDERMKAGEGYGGGVKSKRDPSPSTMPGSKQVNTAKPIGKGKSSGETDRS
jgi:hypothetical protein